jgi:hypothetical protein
MRRKLKKKTLESFFETIEDFDGFEKEKWNLEQHLTPPDIASQIFLHVNEVKSLMESIFEELILKYYYEFCFL